MDGPEAESTIRQKVELKINELKPAYFIVRGKAIAVGRKYLTKRVRIT
jgi:hypothetical protein